MRIEILETEIETKILQDAAKMNMSPTQYVKFVLMLCDVQEPPKIPIHPVSVTTVKTKVGKSWKVKI